MNATAVAATVPISGATPPWMRPQTEPGAGTSPPQRMNLAPRGVSLGPPRLRGIRPPPPPHLVDLLQHRPPRMPFFIREIYKNGFLKRLPHNEKKSSALSKLLRSDRYWVVFSVHDDAHPFLEMWHEPADVATKPPQYIFPLAMCQHISQSIIPADSEWSFVINFDAVAIRFSCNSRETMLEWVDCIRMKLGEMNILNPKGNLYSKVPSGPATKLVRNPMSPLPSPPVTGEETPNSSNNLPADGSRNRLSIVDASDESNATFTTSIYLNQTPPMTPQTGAAASAAAANGEKDLKEKRKNSKSSKDLSMSASSSSSSNKKSKSDNNKENNNALGGARPKTLVASSLSLDSASMQSYETLNPVSPPPPSHALNTPSKSSVYLNKASPTRHVTVIPINNRIIRGLNLEGAPKSPTKTSGGGTLFDLDEPLIMSGAVAAERRQRKEQQRRGNKSPSRRQRASTHDLTEFGEEQQQQQQVMRARSPHGKENRARSPTNKKAVVYRRSSDRKAVADPSTKGYNIQQRIRKRSQRSSSLGPLLDEHNVLSNSLATQGGNTNSLESIDSNPRQAVTKNNMRSRHGSKGETGQQQTPGHRRPLPNIPAASTSAEQQLSSSPPRHYPPHHSAAQQPSSSGMPPHIPLPGLTCQLSLPPGMSLAPAANPPSGAPPVGATGSLREQQVLRLRQEIAHPSGVRLTLRKRDVTHSLALVEFFGFVWVGGWKQRDFPVLYNAFHIGDQIVSVGGTPVRAASDFSKLVKSKNPRELHVEIVIRRLPFAQVFHLRRDIDGQPLGIVTNANTAEIREIVPGSPAAHHGMSNKIRSFEGGQNAPVPWTLTEINGRPLNLFAKEGEAGDRLQAVGRDVSVLVQPADIVAKMRKQLKAVRGYKEYLLG